jgi:hypothetical protein
MDKKFRAFRNDWYAAKKVLCCSPMQTAASVTGLGYIPPLGD